MTKRVQAIRVGEVDGQTAWAYVLAGENGFMARILDYGATLTNVLVPGRDGTVDDVVLGFDRVEDYLPPGPRMGLVGRFANRIKEARFPLERRIVTLDANEGRNHIHGGNAGFDKKLWRSEPLDLSSGPAVRLTYVSPDGEDGYPGTLSVTAVYAVVDGSALSLKITAASDQTTVVNIINHAYFNLSGHGAGSIRNHRVALNASHHTPVDGERIPTGEIRPVEGTALDFRTPKAVDFDVDMNFVVDGEAGTMRRAAEVFDPASGRLMRIDTTAPGVQFYTGQGLGAGTPGKGRAIYGPNGGLCLETQDFPNSPNEPAFPSPIIAPGDVYTHWTIYRFGVAVEG